VRFEEIIETDDACSASVRNRAWVSCERLVWRSGAIARTCRWPALRNVGEAARGPSTCRIRSLSARRSR
jgi:hypothetical protein